MDGNPQIILFDVGSAAWKMDEYKQELWDKCNLGIPHLDIEANDAVILGYMVAQFIEQVCCPCFPFFLIFPSAVKPFSFIDIVLKNYRNCAVLLQDKIGLGSFLC